jgi:prolyl 4-hydroxylase
VLIVVVIGLAAAIAAVYAEADVSRKAALAAMCTRVDECLLPRGVERTTVSDSKPGLDLLRGFLTPDEAAHFISIASDSFQRSVVVHSVTGANVTDPDRTSSSVFLTAGGHDPVIRRVVARAAAVSGVPDSHFEQLQVVRYEPGQFYRPHYDYLKTHLPDIQLRGQRLVTLFVYLNDLPDDETGGGTHFPKAKITVRPELGAAALWYNMVTNGRDILGVHRPPVEDPTTLHGGEPVVKSTKYGLNIWGRTRPQKGSAAALATR